jgi:hypothetical protein
MACRKRSVNYKNFFLIKIVSDILPNGECKWQAVTLAYLNEMKEKDVRDSNDMKMHWIKNLCNNMRKPMGRMDGNDDRVHCCMAI